jgi:cytochrome P450
LDSKALGEAVVDPATYSSEESYYSLFTRLRAEQPLAKAEPRGYRPFWVVSKHADIKTIQTQGAKFTNKERSFLLTIADEQQLAQAQQAGLTAMGRSIVQLDGVEHRTLRMVTNAWFTPSSIKSLEAKIQQIARESIDHMIALGGACDFVKDIALWYPLRVIMLILGLPREDESQLLKLTQAMFSPDDPDTNAAEGAAGMIEASQGIRDYFEAVTQDRRKNPGDDVASVVANAMIGDARISDLDATGYYVTIITAGHDTTSSTTAAALQALVANPGEFAKLRSGSVSIDVAVEEFLRWATPIKHFFRTAQQKGVIRGQTIDAGESLMMCYPSGNRDEEVFVDPHSFRIDRSPNPQLAFGFGAHVCLGQHLARLEMRIFFKELLERIDKITFDGPAALTQANFVQGLKQLPIRYAAKG